MRTCLISFLFFFSLSCFAQRTVATIPVDWKTPVIEMHTICNGAAASSVLMRPDSIRVYQSGADGMLQFAFGLARKVNEDFLGGFYTSDQLILFLDNGNDEGIHAFSYHLQQATVKEHHIPFAVKKEHIIGRLSTNHHFVYLAVDKRSPEFVLYRFANAQEFTQHRFAASATLLDDLDQLNQSLLSKYKPDVRKVAMTGECDLAAAAGRQKLYVQEDSLFLLINRQNGRTVVYHFNIADALMSTRTIVHQTQYTDAVNGSCNSFLLRNKLYYASMCSDSLLLQVCDFYTGRVMAQHTAMKDGHIGFMNTATTKEGEVIENRQAIDTRTASLLKKQHRKLIIIAATADDANNEVQLVIGFSQLETSYAGGGGFVYAGGFGGGAAMLTPAFYSSSWNAVARFKTRLHAFTGAHIPGQLPLTINERIATYTDKIKIPRQGENLFSLNGHFHYVYYDKRQRSISSVLFD